MQMILPHYEESLTFVKIYSKLYKSLFEAGGNICFGNLIFCRAEDKRQTLCVCVCVCVR